jgi:peptidoglycan/LPS O-acetylase OafA/YrhL
VTALRIELASPVRGRVGVLDELKGVAIMLVVLYHAGGVLILANPLHLELGVDMFVVLSGIGLALSSSSDGPGRFLCRRFLRIYPLYWLVLSAVLLGGRFILEIRYYTASDIALHYLGLHLLFGDAHGLTINDSFWFITLIVFLYGSYAALWRFRQRPDWMLCLGFLISFAMASVYLQAGQSACYGYFALRIPGFFVGLVIGMLMRAGKLELPLSVPLACAFLFLFYLPCLQGIVFWSFLVGLGLIASYAFLLRRWVSAAGRSALSFLGVHSLEIFLIHQPLIRAYNIFVLRRVIPGFSPDVPAAFWPLVLGMCVAFAVTLEASIWLHRLFARLTLPPGLNPPLTRPS